MEASAHHSKTCTPVPCRRSTTAFDTIIGLVSGFYPHHGVLFADGVSLVDIARTVGTPVHVYSGDLIDERVGALRRGVCRLRRIGCTTRSRPTPRSAIVRRAPRAGRARRRQLRRRDRGRAPRRLQPELTSCSPASARRATNSTSPCVWASCAVNAESFGEIDRHRRHRRRPKARDARIAMRINPDVDAGSHPHISTGSRATKFGVSADEARAMAREIEGRANLRLVGLHVHVGSQITKAEPVDSKRGRRRRTRAELLDQGVPARTPRSRRRSRHRLSARPGGHDAGRLCGGRTSPAARRHAALARARARPLDRRPEPACIVTEVVDVKPRADGGWFVIVDAGMTDLIRPALYGAWHAHRGRRAARGRADRGRHRRPRLRDERHVRRRTARCRPSRSAICWRFATPAPTARSWRPTTIADRSPPRCSLRRPVRRSSGAARPSTTCSSGTRDAHRIRRTRPKRQGNAGATPARAHLAQRRARRRTRCRSPTTPRRSAARSPKPLPASANIGPDVMQLLYVANRFEIKPRLERWLGRGRRRDLRSLSRVERGLRRGAGARLRRGSRRFSGTCPQPT